MRRTSPKRTPEKKSGSSGKRRIRFSIAAAKGSDVYLAGTFNGWAPARNKLTFKDGLYTTTVLLPRGRHEYKFVINDVWCIDPECSEWAPNGLGSLNSVVAVD